MHIHDHTLIMMALLEKAHLIFKKSKSVNGIPDIEEALDILAEEESNPETKSVIKTIIANLPILNEMKKNISYENLQAVEDIHNHLKRCENAEQMIERLDALSRDYRENTSIHEAIKYTKQILEDGLNSIYNEKYLQDKVDNSKESLKDYLKTDGYGGARSGASLGSIAGATIDGTEAGLSAIGVAVVCGALQASGTRFLKAIANRMKRK